MAGLNVFEYRPGLSFLHRLDPRTKLAGLLLVGVVGLVSAPPVLAVSGTILAAALWRAGISPRQWLRDGKSFWVLLFFVLAARALTAPGTPLARVGTIAITVDGLADGGTICLRLWVVALAGIAVSATTTPAGLEAAMRRFLAPVPGVPEKRAATMLGLLVGFLPEVLRQARLTREAQKARCIEHRKNPVRRLSVFAVSLLRAIFIRADRLALAMEARCYSDHRTAPPLAAGRSDALAAAALAGLLFFSLL